MDFNLVTETFIQSVASKRNNIQRKSLNYKIPLEIFLSYLSDDDFSNLIWHSRYKKKGSKTFKFLTLFSYRMYFHSEYDWFQFIYFLYIKIYYLIVLICYNRLCK